MSWATLVSLVLVIVLVLRRSAPPQVRFDSQAAVRAESKLSQAESAVAANQAYQLTLDRTELNSYLNTHLQLAGNAASSAGTPASGEDNPSMADVQSSVRDVRVDLDASVVKVYVIFDFHGKDLSLELDGQLSSADGYIQFQPVAGWLGSLPLPKSALDAAVQRLVSSPENHEQLHLPAGVDSIAVEGGQLVINYR